MLWDVQHAGTGLISFSQLAVVPEEKMTQTLPNAAVFPLVAEPPAMFLLGFTAVPTLAKLVTLRTPAGPEAAQARVY